MDSRSFHLDMGGWRFQTIYLGKSFVQGHKKPSNIISWGEEGVIAKLSKIQETLFGGEALAMPSSKISSRYRPSA